MKNNIIIKIVITLSIIYWTVFYIIDSNGLLMPIPFILLSLLWCSNTKRYEIKQNTNGEYYIVDNYALIDKYKDVQCSGRWCSEKYKIKFCLTKDFELITKIYNQIVAK